MLPLLLACAPDPVGDATIVVDPPDSVELNDEVNGGTEGIQVDVTGGSAPGWVLGAAWPSHGFTDEGCINEGDVCHTLGDGGGFIVIDTCETPDDGTSCIPADYYRLGDMTFVLKPSLGEGCWVWGDEPDYYAALHCEVTDWSNDSY